jgi:hypothetical protein
MQNWAKRGLQTALVTGGLLMLGTGIASADEQDVNPDSSPSSPLDGSLTIPVDIGDNALGTPGGQVDLPEHQGEYSSKQVTEPLKDALESAGAKAPALPTGDATGEVQKAVRPAAERAGVADEAPSDDRFRGNKGSIDLVVPVQIANNALALFGPAEVSGGDHQQSYDGTSDVQTDGAGQSLAGNVVDVDWALPIQIANNAGGIGGNASSTGNNASQETATGGNVDTDGAGGVLAGNIIAPQGATPVQLNNNAAVLGGNADSSGNTSSSDASSGGSPHTDGTDGVGSGNIAGVPVAVPVELNNSALSGVGIADSSGNSNTANATAGKPRPRQHYVPRYAATSGDGGVLSGNIAQPQAAGDAAVHGVAGTVGGIATSGVSDSRSGSGNTNETNSQAGGYSVTSGQESVLGGNHADAPAALPVEAFCVAGGLVGTAASSCENETSAEAGGATYTDATDSVLGGNGVHAPLASTIEAFGVGGSAVGTADSEATEDKTVVAGGKNGSTGDGSTGGGNIVQTPVAAPIETFGAAGSLVGSSSGTASETKTVSSGGDGNTEDDDAVVGSNVIAAPIAQPVQAFGIGAAGIGHAHGDGTADTETSAGGDYIGSGHGGTGSGNIVQAASSAPLQAFGIGGSGGGEASGTGDNTSSSTAGGQSLTDGSDGELSGNVAAVANSLPAQAHGLGGAIGGEAVGTSTNVTDSTAGGDTDTDGTGSSLGGNVVSAPIAGTAGLFGDAASVAGHAVGDGTNDVVTSSGGSTDTAGDDGSLAGNVIGAQALPIAQVFGDGVSVLGFADGTGDSTTDAVSGGDVATSGEAGSLSGNIFDLPAAAVAQIFGNAISLGGEATGTGDNTTVGSAGGVAQSAGGQATQIPAGVLLQIFNFSGPIAGQALGSGTNSTALTVGESVPQLDLIFDGAEMPIDGLPSLDGLGAPAMPMTARADRPADVTPALMPKPLSTDAPEVAMPLPAPALPGAPADLPALPGSPADVPALPELGGLPELPGLTELPAMPELPGMTELPALPDAPAGTLPAPALPEAPAGTLPAPALPDAPVGTLPAPALPDAPVGTLPAPALPDAPAGTLPAPALPEAPAGTLPAPALPTTSAGSLPAPVSADLPEVAMPLPAPALPGTPATTLPAPRTLPAPAMGAQEAGWRGMWAKFVGFLTNRPMHIES